MDKTDVKKALKIMGAYLKSARHELGLTQEEVAECAEISTTYLRKIEQGTANVSWHIWLKFFCILKLDIEVVKTILPDLKKDENPA